MESLRKKLLVCALSLRNIEKPIGEVWHPMNEVMLVQVELVLRCDSLESAAGPWHGGAAVVSVSRFSTSAFEF